MSFKLPDVRASVVATSTLAIFGGLLAFGPASSFRPGCTGGLTLGVAGASPDNGTDGSCLLCHVPTRESDGPNEPGAGWLWSPGRSPGAYATYADHVGEDDDQIFDRASRQCMACHDGTIALDSFSTEVEAFSADGLDRMGNAGEGDHPVGLAAVYPERGNHGYRPASGDRLGPNGELRLHQVKLGGRELRVVTCLTCHTVHPGEHEHRLRMSNKRSALCLSCHTGADTD